MDKKITFPYSWAPPLPIPESSLIGVFGPPHGGDAPPEADIIAGALARPIGSPPLAEILRDKKRVLIVTDDHHRPTPVRRMIPSVLEEIRKAGIGRENVEFIVALGTHRPMTGPELREKLGDDICEAFRVSNHDWTDKARLAFCGTVPPGIEVWVNRRMREFDVVLGLGSIMPIDVCGFTGGGKIIIPGLCGEKTNSDMHWVRTEIPGDLVVGRRENPIRAAIDRAALAGGLTAVFNAVLDSDCRIRHAVLGHPVEAHRAGARLSLTAHSAVIPEPADIVIADSFPFDIEFWQANKALGHASLAVRDGGTIILVSPCAEGLSSTHEENILAIGYRPSAEIKALVAAGRIGHLVVAVHMIQVAQATFDRDVHCILVTPGIEAAKLEAVNLDSAPNPAAALEAAFRRHGPGARVAVLERAPETLFLSKKDLDMLLES
jgi:nickel-dependent lactate racemase